MAQEPHDVTVSATTQSAVVVTDNPLVWLWRTAANWFGAGAPAVACCLSGMVAHPGAEPVTLVTPARWWRREAARGIATLEIDLARGPLTP